METFTRPIHWETSARSLSPFGGIAISDRTWAIEGRTDKERRPVTSRHFKSFMGDSYFPFFSWLRVDSNEGTSDCSLKGTLRRTTSQFSMACALSFSAV